MGIKSCSEPLWRETGIGTALKKLKLRGVEVYEVLAAFGLCSFLSQPLTHRFYYLPWYSSRHSSSPLSFVFLALKQAAWILEPLLNSVTLELTLSVPAVDDKVSRSTRLAGIFLYRIRERQLVLIPHSQNKIFHQLWTHAVTNVQMVCCTIFCINIVTLE